jgi:NAD(P)-dependent dehydrogenase (short-subunit alcohol dehydrogenase family)
MNLTGKVAIVTGGGRGLGLAYVQALAEAAGITGQAVGIGGDRLALWTHPAEAAVEFAGGDGWSADAIAKAWPSSFGPHHQTTGQQFPEPSQ